ncbi:hypothetical protein FRB91_011808 [Serendipita sp. 411]|nr:hypothetical protein FRC15_000600 [Serendipita sp. 397]KAG8794052.1 hypothetical protein FRC16_010733 [Serendipita sp. 398]KAG8805715.1 hypothetical protein FRC18_006519 [Serendipita sp. 400]KAG8817650.1 hypothetical protein FRC19_011230 [Serendipita sp. 401]KAG8847407.1 hypothetical protein FRB91_011808 [Serendipita sp. 411]KAG8857375.1 hypothetical protein FRC20_000297 [Serendipita sp. 405]KAG9052154.1 hypothetical protein FS842_010409 [Serendipita sp. 407]
MFGCCVAGRLLQTNLQQIDETHCTFSLESAETINHLCVFLLGTVPFPPGYAATVHFYWPDKGFQLLGMLSNEKPSAIFRVRGTFGGSQSSHASHQLFISSSQSSGTTAQLGIAIEPIEVVTNQISNLPPPNKPISDPIALAEGIGKHLVNYLSSFGEVAPGGQVYVPMSAVTKWYDSFMSKVKSAGISFLERQE